MQYHGVELAYIMELIIDFSFKLVVNVAQASWLADQTVAL